jgi:hypothetical protein
VDQPSSGLTARGIDADPYYVMPAESYDELLRNGAVENWSLMNSSGPQRIEWCERLEALARADGLRTNRWGIRSGAGSFDTPVLVLA